MKEIASGEIFANFYEENFIYVDKTEQISAMIKKGRAFLSRPRRFGKSTILDTIGTLFERGKDPYFKDTWIYHHWDDKTYSVLRLNFLTFSTTDFDSFSQVFCSRIEDFARDINLKNYRPSTTPSESLFRLLNLLRNESRKIVILIDEYDCQLTANINDPELYKQFRNCIREIYGVLKGQYAIKFLGITGVTRLKDTTIFSVGSDVEDISFNSNVASITGFTKEEIRKYYHDYLVLTASLEESIPIEKVTERDTEAVLEKLAAEYDGYSFDEDYKVKVFNTWSVNKFFSDVIGKNSVKYGDYWYDNGGIPSILANFLENRTIEISQITDNFISVSYNDFANPVSLLTIDQSVLMTQTGYLTLRSRVSPGAILSLAIPNNEVKRSLCRLSSLKVLGVETALSESARKTFECGSAEDIVSEMNTIINSVSYDHYPLTGETIIRDCLHFFMMGCGFNVAAEAHCANGRSDLCIVFRRRRLVFEFKYGNGHAGCSAMLDDAISQMRNKNYGDVLPKKDETLRIALVFDGHERKFTHWQEA